MHGQSPQSEIVPTPMYHARARRVWSSWYRKISTPRNIRGLNLAANDVWNVDAMRTRAHTYIQQSDYNKLIVLYSAVRTAQRVRKRPSCVNCQLRWVVEFCCAVDS